MLMDTIDRYVDADKYNTCYGAAYVDDVDGYINIDTPIIYYVDGYDW